MGWLKAIGSELLGLFVDDVGFAVSILAWVAVCAVILPILGLSGAVPALILFAGLLAILVESATRRARKAQP